MNELPSVVTFDLDDTLFDECAYVRSGRTAVVRFVAETYGKNVEDLVESGCDDFLALVCDSVGLPPAAKESMLWIYRLHRPNIELRLGMANLIQNLRKNGHPICLLTDGRSATQRLKILALRVRFDSVIISQEIGHGKPSIEGFRQIEDAYPGRSCVYIGDNALKDFLAPRTLGWRTYGLIGENGLYVDSIRSAPATCQPDKWVNNVEALAFELSANSASANVRP